jgi:hypothetical protein
MKQAILWSYSLLFRIGGVVMAVMSGIVSGAIGIGIGIAKDGYPGKWPPGIWSLDNRDSDWNSTDRRSTGPRSLLFCTEG